METRGIEPGQIWEAQTNTGKTSKLLILAVQTGYVNVFYVNDVNSSHSDGFALLNGEGVVDEGRLTFMPIRALNCYLDRMTDAELADIREGFLYMIGEKEERSHEFDVKAALIERERDIYKDMCYRLMEGRRQ